MSGQPRRRVNVDALPWRPILSDPGAEWTGLPVIARAIAMEIMRRLDADFCIVKGSSDTVFDAVCLAIGAGRGRGNQGRKYAREAIELLARHRWLTITSRALCAYFPDLSASENGAGRCRPSEVVLEAGAFPTPKSKSGAENAQPTTGIGPNLHVVGASTTPDRELGAENAQTTRAKPAESHSTDQANRGEKIREEREETRARTSDTPGELGREVTRLQAAIREGLGNRGSPADLTSSRWTDVAIWCRSVVTPKLTLAAVHAQLVRGFVNDPKMAIEGWPVSWLAKNPNQFFVRGRSVSSVAAWAPPKRDEAPASDGVAMAAAALAALRGGSP